MNTDKLLIEELVFKISDGVGVDSLFSIFQMKNGIITLTFEHDNVFDGNKCFLFLIHQHIMR